MFLHMTWEERHIIAEHSDIAYAVFVLVLLGYVLAYKWQGHSRHICLTLSLLPATLLFVSAYELVQIMADYDVSLLSKLLNVLFGMLLIPPTNTILIYACWRNFEALRDSNHSYIPLGWFIPLMVAHVPLAAFTLYLAEP